MEHMFYSCENLTNLNLSQFNTSKVTTMYGMFLNCYKLTNLDLSSFNTASVENMSYMFYECGLTNLDLSTFSSAKLKYATKMFYSCDKLTELKLGDNFTISSVTQPTYMFYDCRSLVNLDLSAFNTASATNMSYMFSYCKALETLVLGDNFVLTKVTTKTSMFTGVTADILSVYVCNADARTTFINNYSAYGASTSSIFKGPLYNFNYTGVVQAFTVKENGVYKLEVWGAQGGGTNTNGGNSVNPKIGGKGGYSTGNIELTAGTTLYVYVGGAGVNDNRSNDSTTVTTKGGFNGGGSTITRGAAGSGGGASDIRIKTDSLYARVIVAGGGGGAGWSSHGFAGGGTYGICYGGSTTSGSSYYSGAGGPTSGGAYSPSNSTSYGQVTAGTFGLGGNGVGNSSGGGGGRWRLVRWPVVQAMLAVQEAVLVMYIHHQPLETIHQDAYLIAHTT